MRPDAWSIQPPVSTVDSARRAESTVETGGWIDQASGRITFRDYVQIVWLPSRQVEVSTLAGYRSYLDKHFLPFFGDRPMAEILPSSVQDLSLIHISEPTRRTPISYAVFCLKKKKVSRA